MIINQQNCKKDFDYLDFEVKSELKNNIIQIQNMFRALIFLLLTLPSISFAQLQDDIFVQADRFLKKYVINGQLKYVDIHKNKKEIDNLTSRIAKINYESFYPNLKKTYLINIYNLLVIKTVSDKYPIITPNEVKGFFTEIKHNINGKNLTLEQLEKEVIFKQFTDPRIHFALIKAANGSPALPNFSFNPQKIDDELDAQCKKALNDPRYIRLGDRNVMLPQIFEWNQADFNEKGQTFIKFINTYRENKISEDWAVGFYPFDWTLNDNMLWEVAQGDGKPKEVKTKPKKENKEKVKTPKAPKDSTIAKPVIKVEPKPVEEKSQIIEEETVRKDSVVNLQLLTPSKLTPKGHIEARTFNSLLSYNQIFSNVKRLDVNRRTTNIISVNQIMFGQTRRLNVGLEFWVKSVYLDTTNQSPLDILGSNPPKYTQAGITGIGPKIKIIPFKKYPNLTLQSTFLVPFSRDLEGRKSKKPYLSADAATLITQLMFDKTFKNKWQLFTQFSPTIAFGRSFGQSRLATPFSVYVGYLASSRLMFYLQNDAYPAFGKNFIEYGYLRQGIGTKIQLIPKMLEGEIAYNLNTTGYKTGAASGVNIGLRYIK